MLFKFKWLRRFIRSHTTPIPVDEAERWRNRLSAIYFFLSFNAVGAVMIAAYKGKMDWAAYYGMKSEEELKTSPAKLWASSLGIQNAKFYRLSGFTLTELDDSVPATENKEVIQEPVLFTDKLKSDDKIIN